MLHVLILLLLFSKLLAPLYRHETPDIHKQPLTLTLVPEPVQQPPSAADPNKKYFVDTNESRPAAKPDSRTPFEGERNTLPSSPQAGKGNPFLPSQTGINVPGINLLNQEYTPQLEGNPQPPTPESQAKENTKQQEQRQPQKAVEAKEEIKKPRENLTPRPDGIFGITEPVEPRKAQEEVTPAKAAQQQTTSNPSQPSSSFTAQKRANTIEGGAAPDLDSSIGAQESEMGRYKAKVFRAIGSRWYIYVNKDSGIVSIGTVRIKFFIRSDGVITDLQILEGKQLSGLLAVSRRSIMEVSGQLEPFSQSMKEQLGNGYWEEVSFTIY